jgi:hypothetical protein
MTLTKMFELKPNAAGTNGGEGEPTANIKTPERAGGDVPYSSLCLSLTKELLLTQRRRVTVSTNHIDVDTRTR